MTSVKGIVKDNQVIAENSLTLYNGRPVVITVLDGDTSQSNKTYDVHVTFYKEDDGSFTGVVEELDLVENSNTKASCKEKIVYALKDYAEDFCKDYDYWASYNRLSHIPYVLKILSSTEAQIKELLVCQDGEN